MASMSAFTAISVDTANESLQSICRVGLAKFENNELAKSWEILIDPKSPFDPVNSAVHGITAEFVLNKPTLQRSSPSSLLKLATVSLCTLIISIRRASLRLQRPMASICPELGGFAWRTLLGELSLRYSKGAVGLIEFVKKSESIFSRRALKSEQWQLEKFFCWPVAKVE